jgi:hypothetical protein
VVDATGGRKISRRVVSERASERTFFGISALLFAASVAVTNRLVRVHGGDGSCPCSLRIIEMDLSRDAHIG